MVYNLKVEGRSRTVVGAIRRGQWKLVRTKYKYLLYNLEDDFKELRNLAPANPSISNELKMLFNKMAASIVSEDSKTDIYDGRNSDSDGNVRSGWCKV